MKSWTNAWREARAQQVALHPDNPNGGQFIWNDRVYTTEIPLDANADANFDPSYVVEPAQGIWFKEEISVAQELEQMIPALAEEFLANTPGFHDGDLSQNINLHPPIYSLLKSSVKDSQLSDGIKWSDLPRFQLFQENKKYEYPTIVNYVKKLGEDCASASYMVLLPSYLKRQISVENTANKFVRIYVPLVIPNNDTFVEVEGIEINHRDIFAIDTTLMHSDHNLSDKPRLVLIIDISREYLGLPAGKPWDEQRQKHIAPFVRGAQPRMYHTVER